MYWLWLKSVAMKSSKFAIICISLIRPLSDSTLLVIALSTIDFSFVSILFASRRKFLNFSICSKVYWLTSLPDSMLKLCLNRLSVSPKVAVCVLTWICSLFSYCCWVMRGSINICTVSHSSRYDILRSFWIKFSTYAHSIGVFLKSKIDCGRSIEAVCFGISGIKQPGYSFRNASITFLKSFKLRSALPLLF